MKKLKEKILNLLSDFLDLLGLRINLYVDLDGTVAQLYEHKDWWDRSLNDNEFFATLDEYEKLIMALRLIKKEYGIRVKIHSISAVLEENEENIKKCKNIWINNKCSFVQQRIFCLVGEQKSKLVKKLNRKAILLDDFTFNCEDWRKKGGFAIKINNGLNCKSGNWNGPILNNRSPVEEQYAFLTSFM